MAVWRGVIASEQQGAIFFMDITLMHDTNTKSQFTSIKLLSVMDFRKQISKTSQQVPKQGFTVLLGK